MPRSRQKRRVLTREERKARRAPKGYHPAGEPIGYEPSLESAMRSDSMTPVDLARVQASSPRGYRRKHRAARSPDAYYKRNPYPPDPKDW